MKVIRPCTVAALVTVLLLVAACGGEPGEQEADEQPEEAQEERGNAAPEETADETAAALEEAEVGPEEESSMMPAGGADPDPAQPLPEEPPEGVELYPATTNETTEDEVSYDREPPTNGDHDPLWQNCGFYEEPIEDRYAVHSLDHGVVWITYRPDLPEEQVEELRPYGDERYVIVSPYPGQSAPVTATAWRLQLELDGPEDPRLGQFVDQFQITELAPLSGNGCTGGTSETSTR